MSVESLLRKSAAKVLDKKDQDQPPPGPSRPDLLSTIQSPADLRALPPTDLPFLAGQIRSFMLEHVSQHGGHLAPSLGAVELAIALHYCYNTPDDKIIWDVGHQCYAHKILTGRRERFPTLRQTGGISGFPRVSESPYDSVSTGHASTSISAGLGIAIARDLRGEKHEVVAVIGDGALSGGLAFEGLNNLGSQSTKMTVVLNDNKMSISRNVGALSRYLTRLITDRRFDKIKTDVWNLLGSMPNVGISIRNLVHNVDDALKHFVIPGKLFEDMGLRYFGPVDGHNAMEMVEVFRFVRDHTSQPSLIHVITTKGKGYRFAENDATRYHGVGSFSLSTGTSQASGPRAPTYSDVFGKTLSELARADQRIVAITAAMPDGTGLTKFRDEFPGRFFDVGIAESHAVTFAAGLALAGMKPVVAIYSTFVQRAYDQVLHDVALDRLNVVFCLDRAGIVGEDGPTHHGMFDLSYARTVPNVTIMAPRNESELRDMLFTAVSSDLGPVFIRYPRGTGTGAATGSPMSALPLYRPEIVAEGAECAVVAVGDACAAALAAREIVESGGGKPPAVVNARFVKPLDRAFYEELFARFRRILTLEYNSLSGGFGSAVLELAHHCGVSPLPRIDCLGLPDSFVEHGERSALLTSMGLDPGSIAECIRATGTHSA